MSAMTFIVLALCVLQSDHIYGQITYTQFQSSTYGDQLSCFWCEAQPVKVRSKLSCAKHCLAERDESHPGFVYNHTECRCCSPAENTNSVEMEAAAVVYVKLTNHEEFGEYSTQLSHKHSFGNTAPLNTILVTGNRRQSH